MASLNKLNYVVLSAGTSGEAIQPMKAYTGEVQLFLPKPFTMNDLAMAVHQALK